MSIQVNELEENKTRVNVSVNLHTLDGKQVSVGTALLYASVEQGWPQTSYSFHIIERLALAAYVEKLFPNSEEYHEVAKTKPHPSDDANDQGKFRQRMIEAKEQLTQRIQAETNEKPFTELLEQLIVLSEYQLGYLVIAQNADDTFPRY